MAYENCPKCGTRKHVLVKCLNCGFSRSGQGLNPIKCPYCGSNIRPGRFKSHVEYGYGCSNFPGFAARAKAKLDEERANREHSLCMLKKKPKVPIRIVSGGLPSLGKKR